MRSLATWFQEQSYGTGHVQGSKFIPKWHQKKRGTVSRKTLAKEGHISETGFAQKAASFVFIDILQQVRKNESKNCGIYHGLQGIHGFCGTHSELEDSLNNNGDEHTHTE